MRLFLIRHGETVWNKEEVFRGRADVPLNGHGREQAERAGQALAGLELAAVYSSPLSRAVETARAVAAPHGLQVEILEGLNDLDYGNWEGLSLKEVEERYPADYRTWAEAPHTVTFEGGESLEMARHRAVAAVEQIKARHTGCSVAVVTHRVICKLLLLHFMGVDSSRFWLVKQDTCAINLVEFPPGHGPVLCKVNDTCHLRPLTGGLEIRDF